MLFQKHLLEGNENWRDLSTNILAALGFLQILKTPREKVVKILRPLGPKMEDEGRIGSSLAAFVEAQRGAEEGELGSLGYYRIDEANLTENSASIKHLQALDNLVAQVLVLDEDDEREDDLSTQSADSEREERGVERTGG